MRKKHYIAINRNYWRSRLLATNLDGANVCAVLWIKNDRVLNGSKEGVDV